MKKSLWSLFIVFILSLFFSPPFAFAYEEASIEQEEAIVKERVIQYFNPLSTINEQLAVLSLAQRKNSYSIQPGDQLIKIANDFEVSMNQLVTLNQIRDPNNIAVGKKLYIPIEYLWELYDEDETIVTFAKKYNVDKEDLLKANPELQKQKPYVGQLVAIPQQAFYRSLIAKNTKSKVVAASRSTSIPTMSWPVQGIITSKYGYRWGQLHTGLDIWNEGGYQTSIKAAYHGIVKAAGPSGNGYGNLIVIQHQNQLETYYAHLSQIFVEQGQEVNQGDVIGKMGETGYTTGVHLHFEIRYQDRPYNPIIYLQ